MMSDLSEDRRPHLYFPGGNTDWDPDWKAFPQPQQYVLLNNHERYIEHRTSRVCVRLPLDLIARGSRRHRRAMQRIGSGTGTMPDLTLKHVASNPEGFTIGSPIAAKLVGWREPPRYLQPINDRFRDMVWAANVVATAAAPEARILSSVSFRDASRYTVRSGVYETGLPLLYIALNEPSSGL